jgi:hypothetical protein
MTARRPTAVDELLPVDEPVPFRLTPAGLAALDDKAPTAAWAVAWWVARFAECGRSLTFDRQTHTADAELAALACEVREPARTAVWAGLARRGES